jgi:hypothetical protein
VSHQNKGWRPPLWTWGCYAVGIGTFVAGVVIMFQGRLYIGVAVVVAAFLMTSVATAGLSGLYPHHKGQRCPSCGYDLAGLSAQTRCPECGQAL